MEPKTESKTMAVITILVAIIGCVGLLGAALINTLPEILRSTTAFSISTPIESIPSPIAQSPTLIENTPVTNLLEIDSASTSTSPSTGAVCFDWDTCWSFDDNAKTMTWLGASNGDIGLRGVPLTKLQSGYTAIITISVPMTIEICKGTLDGAEIGKDCNPQFLTIESGVHKITSPGNQGGFRAYPK